MSNALTGAIEEASTLLARIISLQKFIDGNDYVKLSVRDRSLLQEQDRYMVGYLNTLRIRVDRFAIKEQESE